MNKLFYELIQVAIGKYDHLSRLPSEAEWEELFDMAVKQSLVGVCFIGLHTLGADSDEGFTKIGMSEDLFFDWMGMAAQINMTNEIVNKQCVILQKRLAADGFKSCILKGQGVAVLYQKGLDGIERSDLPMFRQSGDIDVYVPGGQQIVLKWCNRIDPLSKYDYVHSHLKMFDDTPVEVHYRYGCLYNLVSNFRLQRWFAENEIFVNVELPNGAGRISVPSIEFNVVYQLHHLFRHLFVEGIGLRQVMDYYFVLCNLGSEGLNNSKVCEDLNRFGMLKFASALMYVLKVVFGLDRKYMICEPNVKEGSYLLDRIMETGNFGNKSKKIKIKKNSIERWVGIVKHSMHLTLHYPMEAISAPIWHIFHFIWKRTFGRLK